MKKHHKDDNDSSTNKSTLGVMVAKMPTAKKAARNAESMKNCPRLLASGVRSNLFLGVFIAPEDMKWWFTLPEEKPDLLGADEVSITLVDQIAYPAEFQPHLPDELSETSPCGTNCAK
ncbi:MAG: hypothetical protein KGY80_04355 [Candidatus Thorarchaeota archaeon]|nr:hypothetical protein [Candidatus Thorarchaeota archaeon]